MFQKPKMSTKIIRCKSCRTFGFVTGVVRNNTKWWHVFFNQGCSSCMTSVTQQEKDEHFIRKTEDPYELNDNRDFNWRFEVYRNVR